MNADLNVDPFERLLAGVLADAAPSREPDRLVPEILRAARRERRWSRWLALIKEPPMRIHARVAVGSPPVRLAVILAATVVLALTATSALVVGATLLSSTSPEPGPVQLGHNGLIAYDTNGDIMVVNPDGSDPRVLIGGSHEDTGPVWSPDGKQIAFWRDRILAVANADGTNQVVYKFPAVGYYENGNSNIDWGPNDGRIMVRNSSDDAVLVDLASGAASRVAEVEDRRARIFSLDWSNDGKTVATTGWDSAPHYEFVHVATLGTPGVTELVRSDPVNGSLLSVLWDPTGTKLTYARGEDVSGFTGASMPDQFDGPVDIFTFDIKSRTATMLAQGTYTCPVWSPDGLHIAFGGDQQSALIVDADGSNLRKLSQPLGACDMRYSPDGTHLVSFISDVQGNVSLAIADPSSDAPAVTIAAPGNMGGPSWQWLP